MKLESISEARGGLILVFVNDGERISKRMPVDGIAIRVAAARRVQVRRYGLLKRVIEAERDFAFSMFGDAWPERVGAIGCDMHIGALNAAVRMRPDLFADEAC